MAVKNEVIIKSLLSHIQQVIAQHGIKECIVIFPIMQPDGKAVSISCNQMKIPGRPGLPQMEAIKATCDQVLIQMQGNGKS